MAKSAHKLQVIYLLEHAKYLVQFVKDPVIRNSINRVIKLSQYLLQNNPAQKKKIRTTAKISNYDGLHCYMY